MRRSVENTFADLILVGAILVIALNTWFAVSSVRALQESGLSVAHTYQVIGQVQRVMVRAKDAESANRGFIISGDNAYLLQFQEAETTLPKDVQSLKSLTQDNLLQQHRMSGLQSLVDQRLAVLRASIAARQSAGFDADQLGLIVAGSKGQMDQLSSALDDIEAEERRLLAIRNRKSQTTGMIADLAIGLASFFDFLLMIAIYRYFARERDLRIATEQAAEQAQLARAEAERSAGLVLELNTELEERVRQRTAELETTNRELEAFSYSVSHDLRAPLRTIDGFSLALEEDYAIAVDATGRDYISRVRAGVQRMGGLIDALLQLSRITRADIQREQVDVTALAVTVAKNLQEENPTSELHFNIQTNLLADADPRLLQVALENLMGNAVKFSSKKPSSDIEVGWSPAENAWFVRDNGAGFDMHYQEKLFNAFNRLHGDKDFKGSGIGLATVARVVRRHHGRIWAQGEVGHGATFWFTLG